MSFYASIADAKHVFTYRSVSTDIAIICYLAQKYQSYEFILGCKISKQVRIALIRTRQIECFSEKDVAVRNGN